mmetsp:Transcript_76334/g.171233  ORF Transcript_76334/g.171233 Transcript_76334/m.171233 type:complete len:383 (-) Transcript_76334:22-1170(-)
MCSTAVANQRSLAAASEAARLSSNTANCSSSLRCCATWRAWREANARSSTATPSSTPSSWRLAAMSRFLRSTAWHFSIRTRSCRLLSLKRVYSESTSSPMFSSITWLHCRPNISERFVCASNRAWRFPRATSHGKDPFGHAVGGVGGIADGGGATTVARAFSTTSASCFSVSVGAGASPEAAWKRRIVSSKRCAWFRRSTSQAGCFSFSTLIDSVCTGEGTLLATTSGETSCGWRSNTAPGSAATPMSVSARCGAGSGGRPPEGRLTRATCSAGTVLPPPRFAGELAGADAALGEACCCRACKASAFALGRPRDAGAGASAGPFGAGVGAGADAADTSRIGSGVGARLRPRPRGIAPKRARRAANAAPSTDHPFGCGGGVGR